MNLQISKLNSTDYLLKEFKNIRDNLLTALGCTIETNPSIFHWKITLIGPKDTPYADGIFILKVDFVITYPYPKPEIRFVNKIYHLNISSINGSISLPILDDWTPYTNMLDIISNIFNLFYNQVPSNSFDLIRAEEYKTDINEFNRKAKEWTKKYASKNNKFNN